MSENGKQILRNDQLVVESTVSGAELCSIKDSESGFEFLWQADPAFWKRHSPVLFPIVGSVWNKQFKVNGQVFEMSQHGFARDSEFTLLSASDTSVSYQLKSSEDTLKKFPYPFELTITYTLEGRTVNVEWKVRNPSDKQLDFQIGAHPAFYFPDFDKTTKERGFFLLEKRNDNGQWKPVTALDRQIIEEQGCVGPDYQHIQLDDKGLLKLTTDTFAKDALVLDNHQVERCTLLDNECNEYITLEFKDAPLVGLWSPPGKNAPFVCIEPWYGRCDKAGYDGEFCNREWMNHLQGGEERTFSYSISL